MALTFASPPRISSAKFRDVLTRGTSAGPSPCAPIAFECYDIIAAAGLDPACLLAIFAKESQYGMTGIAPTTHNWGNVRQAWRPSLATDPGGIGRFASYPSWQNGLKDLCARLTERYIAHGLTTPEAILPVYAPTSENDTAGYIAFVNSHVLAWQAEETSMAFAWEPRRWNDLAEFKAYLATIQPPAWMTGITFHNTGAPTRDQWIGLQHVVNLGHYYQFEVVNQDGSKGWPAGPHLFLAAATAHDGIYQGTPLQTVGVHAGPCNSDHLGIEIVGNYSLEPWPSPVAELVYGVLAALSVWAKVPNNRVVGHRECMPGHTECPGTKIDPAAVRVELARRMTIAPPSVNYEAMWKAKNPGIAYNVQFGFPTTYRNEYDAGRPLGAALSGEFGDQVVWQVFEAGVMRLDKHTGQIRVLR